MILKSRLLLGALTISLSLAIAATLSLAADKIEPGSIQQPQMTPALNMGKLVYDAKCAACHGAHTAGADKGPTFLHRVYHPGHHGDRAFAVAAKNGVRAHHWPFGDMPPVADISDSQIEKIVGYVRAMQKANGVF